MPRYVIRANVKMSATGVSALFSRLGIYYALHSYVCDVATVWLICSLSRSSAMKCLVLGCLREQGIAALPSESVRQRRSLAVNSLISRQGGISMKHHL